MKTTTKNILAALLVLTFPLWIVPYLLINYLLREEPTRREPCRRHYFGGEPFENCPKCGCSKTNT